MNSLVRDKVKRLVLIGEAAPMIKKHWGSLVETVEAKTMDDAVVAAAALAGQGDVVLLSPACASWDMFKDYEDRGRAFKRSVRQVLEA
ncbi:hypothetical protein HZA57_04830 [Candidatus Poribacteria bacterium]|nr:hypothetical protein [Candidatus Poribacteria bacterium]